MTLAIVGDKQFRLRAPQDVDWLSYLLHGERAVIEGNALSEAQQP